MTCCFYFFSCVLFELPNSLSLPPLLALSFCFVLLFSLIRVRYYHYVSHIHHSHTSLSHSSCTLIVNFSCCKNRFLVQPAAVNLCIVCVARWEVTRETESGLKLESEQTHTVTSTFTSLFISWAHRRTQYAHLLEAFTPLTMKILLRTACW